MLVGRDAEMGRLREALDEAARGHGRLVMVVGEAGIGKTTLLRWLAAEAGHRGARVLPGRSYESEQILPFAPWVDAFRTGQVVFDAEVLLTLISTPPHRTDDASPSPPTVRRTALKREPNDCPGGVPARRGGGRASR
jgi:energy-coupling factor transporter ATP-binding protein EcfA2